MVLSRLLTSGFPCGLIREPRAHVYHAAAAALLDPADDGDLALLHSQDINPLSRGYWLSKLLLLGDVIK